ncbi:hypothetical protein [Myxococcus stipitatus]|uniref:hypothetical protein n=1 Tax=Myxococcus stipitatus TaxID=83455 RepID=UPI0030CEB0EE
MPSARRATGFTSEQPTYAVAVDASGKVAFRPGDSARLVAGGAPELVLETVGWGRGRVVAPPVGGVAALEDGGLALDRGSVRETLRNGEKGTEQAWEVDREPEGEGPLTVRVRVTGQRFVQSSAEGLHFAPEDGEGPGVRYGLATWVDARGTCTPLPAPRHENGEVVRRTGRVVRLSM